MRITRDPHDPDHVIKFETYKVTANGSPLDMSTILEVDQEKGIIKMFFKPTGTTIPARENTDPKQPDFVQTQAESIEIVEPEVCSHCAQTAAFNLKRRQIAADKWWEAV